ncbi:hypothetical protein B2J88_50840, partial [Rhodococcus sp. SRB_17]|nr:hypothetical protein [Rhodococcus sp. SRB_17]
MNSRTSFKRLSVVLASAAVLGLGVSAPQVANAQTQCDDGPFGPGHCYGVWKFGQMKNGVPQSMAGLAADLKVDCLRVGDPQNKLATHEIWMATNTNYNHAEQTWVETGYTAGKIDTMNAGLIWGDNHFWADQR